jgi:hypothetical protein
MTATAILEAQRLQNGSPYTDFGAATYTTEQFEYALECGYLKSGGSSVRANNSGYATTVLVFPVPRVAIENYPGALYFRNHAADIVNWKALVSACRQDKFASLPKQDVAAFEAAPFVSGPVTENAEAVDAGRYEAVMSAEIRQIAFKDLTLLEDAIEQGKVHVIRVLHEREHEWDAPSSRDGCCQAQVV